MVIVQEYSTDTVRILIERGLGYLRQALYAEAYSILMSARSDVARSHSTLLESLDAVLARCIALRQMQQELMEASRRFAFADAAQQSSIEELQTVLLSVSDASPASAATNGVEQPIAALPPLHITCFDRFSVRRGNSELELCANRNGRAILRYLVAQPQQRASADALMEALWPDDEPDVARHKLHVAVSALRNALNHKLACAKGGGYLLHDNGIYQLNPDATITTDVARFISAYQAGQRVQGAERVQHFATACALYNGPFLSEDLYADWSVIKREQLTQMYLQMCRELATDALNAGRYDDAITRAMALLSENRCDEEAYRLLIAANVAAGRRAEALRVYRRCQETLRLDLGMEPDAETTALLERVVG